MNYRNTLHVRAVNRDHAFESLREGLTALLTWCQSNHVKPDEMDAWGNSAFERAQSAIQSAEPFTH